MPYPGLEINPWPGWRGQPWWLSLLGAGCDELEGPGCGRASGLCLGWVWVSVHFVFVCVVWVCRVVVGF